MNSRPSDIKTEKYLVHTMSRNSNNSISMDGRIIEASDDRKVSNLRKSNAEKRGNCKMVSF
jgi:hypothetical protein